MTWKPSRARSPEGGSTHVSLPLQKLGSNHSLIKHSRDLMRNLLHLQNFAHPAPSLPRPSPHDGHVIVVHRHDTPQVFKLFYATSLTLYAMKVGCGACSRDLVLLPLRHQLPEHLAGQILWGFCRLHLQPAAGALGKAHSAHLHLVGGVAIGEVTAKSKRGFVPRSLLPLQAVGCGAPIVTLGREETGRPSPPVSRSRLVRARRHKVLVDVVLCRQVALQRSDY